MLLKCDWCDKEFEKQNKEYNRRIKVKPETKFFCTRTCSTSYGNKINPRVGAIENFKGHFGRRPDEYSPFNYFTRNARRRKQHSYNIDSAYLKEIWDKQRGLCAISGIELIPPKNSTGWDKNIESPWKASLDRIDSSKGYIKGNVQFVTYIANMCKMSWSDETVIEFCKKAAQYNEQRIRQREE